jgi:hypothetical protein
VAASRLCSVWIGVVALGELTGTYEGSLSCESTSDADPNITACP